MSTITPNFTHPRVKKWTAREYNDAVNRGWFDRMKIFLYHGELIEMPAHGQLHAYAVGALTEYLVKSFAPLLKARIQLPLILPGESVPEPDAAVVTVDQSKRFPHPNEALLIVEVSDSSIVFDREMSLEYAGANVPEYWIIDCQNRCVEIYTNRVEDQLSASGWKYANVRVATERDQISPQFEQSAKLTVRDLFL